MHILRRALKCAAPCAKMGTVTNDNGEIGGIRREKANDMSDDERQGVIAENKRKQHEQIVANANAILQAVLEDHPDETLEILALVCFIEPEDVDDHAVEEYLDAFTEVIGNSSVINFFISLARLENLNTLTH